MKSVDERTYRFIIRIWEERREIMGAEPLWRGSVDNVRDGSRTYFATLVELCDYLREQCGMTPLHPPPAN